MFHLVPGWGAGLWNTLYIQGDQKSSPPIQGRDEKFSGKMEYSIFKYNLFKYYLELFGFSALTNDPFFREVQKRPFFPNFDPKIALKLPKNSQDKKDTMIS